MRTEPRHDGTAARPSPRHIRAAAPNKGFFTLGFVVAVLVASALGVGMVEVVAPESDSVPSLAEVDRSLPVDRAEVEDVKNVAASEAAARAANESRIAWRTSDGRDRPDSLR